MLAEVVTTLGSIPIADYGTPSTSELADAVQKFIKAHDGLLLANHGALTIANDLFAAYYKMETVEHFAKISLTARLLGGERMLSREEVERLQGLRGMYGIAAPAPICPDGSTDAPETSDTEDFTCQTLQAPISAGERLVRGEVPAPDNPVLGTDGEIRLTYRELTALIEDAVRQLR